MAEPLTCYSAGWIVAENDRALVIVPHMHAADPERGIAESGVGDLTIPAVAIVKITDLLGAEQTAAA